MAQEKNFENNVKKWLTGMGIYALGTEKQKMTVAPVGYWEKRYGGGKFSRNGLPDMHICVKGVDVEVELKASNGKPSEIQKRIIHQIVQSGGIAIVLYPDDFGLFKQMIWSLRLGAIDVAKNILNDLTKGKD